jgi:hypothetical protein
MPVGEIGCFDEGWSRLRGRIGGLVMMTMAVPSAAAGLRTRACFPIYERANARSGAMSFLSATWRASI